MCRFCEWDHDRSLRGIMLKDVFPALAMVGLFVASMAYTGRITSNRVIYERQKRD